MLMRNNLSNKHKNYMNKSFLKQKDLFLGNIRVYLSCLSNIAPIFKCGGGMDCGAVSGTSYDICITGFYHKT